MNNNFLARSVLDSGFEVISFTKDSEHMPKFLSVLEVAALEPSELQGNYDADFDFDNQILFSLVQKDGLPVMFSTIHARPFYGAGVLRCLSRMWKVPELRSIESAIHPSPNWQTMLSHQVEFAMQAFEKPPFLFISHQKHHPRLMKLWAECASQTTRLEWMASDRRHLVYPNPDLPSCWQWICHTKPKGFANPFQSEDVIDNSSLSASTQSEIG